MSKPTVDIEHVEGDPTALLVFHNLIPEHIEALRPVLLHNGDDFIHHLRSEAGAHTERWTPDDGVVTVRMHKQTTGMFIAALCKVVGVVVVESPDDPRWGIKS